MCTFLISGTKCAIVVLGVRIFMQLLLECSNDKGNSLPKSSALSPPAEGFPLGGRIRFGLRFAGARLVEGLRIPS